jgi:hypothetical protein
MYIIWGVALALLVAAGLFSWLVVVPVMQVRSAVRNCRWNESMAELLGGPDEARGKLLLFVRLPSWATDGNDRHMAADALGSMVEWEEACRLYHASRCETVKGGLFRHVFVRVKGQAGTATRGQVLAWCGPPDRTAGGGSVWQYERGAVRYTVEFDGNDILKKTAAFIMPK